MSQTTNEPGFDTGTPPGPQNPTEELTTHVEATTTPAVPAQDPAVTLRQISNSVRVLAWVAGLWFALSLIGGITVTAMAVHFYDVAHAASTSASADCASQGGTDQTC
jgi:hypothetical protein